MEEAITKYLLNSASLVALIGSNLTWALRPQGDDPPGIVLTTVSNIPQYSDSGEAGLASSRVQIDCWGVNYLQAKQVAREVKALLSGVSFDQDGIEFQGSFTEDEQDSFEEGVGGDNLNRVRLDFNLWYSQP